MISLKWNDFRSKDPPAPVLHHFGSPSPASPLWWQAWNIGFWIFLNFQWNIFLKIFIRASPFCWQAWNIRFWKKKLFKKIYIKAFALWWQCWNIGFDNLTEERFNEVQIKSQIYTNASLLSKEKAWYWKKTSKAWISTVYIDLCWLEFGTFSFLAKWKSPPENIGWGFLILGQN